MQIKIFHKKLLGYLFLYGFIVSILYGTTYQQYRFFDIDNVIGIGDTIGYVKMAEEGVDFNSARGYRFIIPLMVKHIDSFIVAPLVHAIKPTERSIILSYYVVNFFFTSLAAFFFGLFLLRIGFNVPLTLIGISLFCSSRIVVLCAATPLVDSIFYFAIAVLFWLIIAKKTALFYLCAPFLILSKELMAPLLLIPLVEKKFRTWYSCLIIVFSFLWAKFLKMGLAVLNGNEPLLTEPTVDKLFMCLNSSGRNVRIFFTTVRGFHDVVCGFSLFFIFAIIGFFINQKNKKYRIPHSCYVLIIVALFFVLLGNPGRGFFTAYITVYTFALIAIEWCIDSLKLKKSVIN